jgi:AcrR family transcriptional regulator
VSGEPEASPAAARRGGRPTRLGAAELGERILTVATRLFLEHGFGATSIEAVAATAGVSKRTFYHRFRDKPDLFRAVVHRLVAGWSTPFEQPAGAGESLEDVLHRTAQRILAAALSPEALALYRILIAEAPRFPELAAIMNRQGAARGMERIAQLLTRAAEAGELAIPDAGFATEQFVNMVLAAPRRRALGIGKPMTSAELDRWMRRTVALFLDGTRRR